MQPLIAGILMKFYKDVAAKKGEASSESEVDKGSEDESDVQQQTPAPVPIPEPTKKQIEKEKEEQSEPQTAPKIRTVYTIDEPIETEAYVKDSKAIDDQEQNLKEKTAKRGKKKEGKKIKYEDIKKLVDSGKVESQPVATDKVKSETSKTSQQDGAVDKSATEIDDDSDLELPDVMAFNLSSAAGQRRRAVHYIAVSEHSLENQEPGVADEEKNSDSNECPPDKVEATDESAENKEEPAGDSSQTTGGENSDDFTEIKIEIPQCNVENIEISDDSVNDRNSSATKNKMSKPLREDSELWVPRGKVHSAEADLKQTKMGKVNEKTSGIRRRRCAACGRQTDRTSSGWIQHKVNRITSPDPRQIRGTMREENNVNKTVGIRKRRCALCGLHFESDDTLNKGNKDQHKSDYYVVMRKYNGQTIKYNRGDFREKPKADSIIKQRCAACGYQEGDSERRKEEKGKKVRQDVIDINIKVDHVQPKTNIRRARCAACGQLEVETWQMKDEQVMPIKADRKDLEGQDNMQVNTRKDKTVKEAKEKDKTDSIRKRNCSACVEHIELKEQSVRKEFLVMFFR